MFKTKNFPENHLCKLAESSEQIVINKKDFYLYSKNVFDETNTFKGNLMLIYDLSSLTERKDQIKKHINHLFTGLGAILALVISFGAFLNFLTRNDPRFSHLAKK